MARLLNRFITKVKYKMVITGKNEKDRCKMEIQKDIKGEIVILRLSGKLDASTGRALSSDIDNLIRKQFNLLIIEMSNLSFLDSTGLGVCIRAHRTVNEKNGIIIFVRPGESVAKNIPHHRG